MYFYCPQTKFAKVMFLQVSVVRGVAGSMAEGVCTAGGAWQGGMHGRGRVW